MLATSTDAAGAGAQKRARPEKKKEAAGHFYDVPLQIWLQTAMNGTPVELVSLRRGGLKVHACIVPAGSPYISRLPGANSDRLAVMSGGKRMSTDGWQWYPPYSAAGVNEDKREHADVASRNHAGMGVQREIRPVFRTDDAAKKKDGRRIALLIHKKPRDELNWQCESTTGRLQPTDERVVIWASSERQLYLGSFNHVRPLPKLGAEEESSQQLETQGAKPMLADGEEDTQGAARGKRSQGGLALAYPAAKAPAPTAPGAGSSGLSPSGGYRSSPRLAQREPSTPSGAD